MRSGVAFWGVVWPSTLAICLGLVQLTVLQEGLEQFDQIAYFSQNS